MSEEYNELAEAFSAQDAQIQALVTAMQARQEVIQDVQNIYAETQEQLALLHQQIQADSHISELTSKVQASTQELSKLVTNIKLPKIPNFQTFK